MLLKSTILVISEGDIAKIFLTHFNINNMLRNFLKIALRNIWKQRIFSTINVLGLSLGMACCFLVILYYTYETGYDRFDEKADRIYQVQYHVNFAEEAIIARIPPPFGPLLTDYFPEVEVTARLYGRNVSITVPSNQNQIELEQVYFVDSTIITVFDLDFISGNSQTALKKPFSVILTEETANILFGHTNVLGNRLQLVDRDEFVVTGVIRDWPDQSHLAVNMLIPYDNMFDIEPAHARESIRENFQQNKIASHSLTYVLLRENQDPENVNAKFDDFLLTHGSERFRDKQSFSIFPIIDLHLYSTASSQPRGGANVDYLYLFIGIGLITLFIACINFINLSTAGSMARAKEVGIRKILGSNKGSLIIQFLGESLVLSFAGFLISIILVMLALPYLNNLTSLQISYSPISNPEITLLFIAVFVIVGILAGTYPSFVVSRFKPVKVLKGSKGNASGADGNFLRKVLITLQFLAAVGFIAGALSVYTQLRYLREKPLGFNKDLILSVPINSANFNAIFRPGDPQIRRRMNQLDETLSAHAKINAVTQCFQQPGFGAVGRVVWTDDILREDNLAVRVLAVDYDYAETYELEIVAGREFDVSYGTDHRESYLINETALGVLKWKSAEEALGKHLVVERKEGKVIGVVKDYNFESLRQSIEPLILEVNPGVFSYYAIRIEDGDVPNTIAYIEDQWANFFPEKVFEYTFLDESLDSAYRSEEALSGMIGYLAFVAVFIACFGLFGLAALTTRQRFKEIGIRKVLGASINQILNILSIDFLKLISLSIIIAAPLTWYFVDGWLAEFAYHIDFPWWVYIVTGLGVLLIAGLTIFYQAIKAAFINPVDTLRYE